VSPRVRHQCLCALVKIVNYSAPESLTETLRDIPLSSFLATLLSSRDLGLVVASLQLAHLCSNKLPAIFLGYFHREGVLHELERLATSPTVVASLEHLSSGLVPSSAPAGASSASSAAAGETDDSNSRNPSASFSDLFRRARERASLGGAGADPAGGSAAQTSSKESDEDVRSWVTQQALALRSALSAHSQEENSEGSPSHKIATLGAKLTSHGNSTQEDLYILKDICALFSKATSSDSVSSFELFNSGLIDRYRLFGSRKNLPISITFGCLSNSHTRHADSYNSLPTPPKISRSSWSTVSSSSYTFSWMDRNFRVSKIAKLGLEGSCRRPPIWPCLSDV